MIAPVDVTELGVERRCNACGEWWPLDDEFFYRQRNGYAGFQGRCKACVNEARGFGQSNRGRLLDRSLIRAMLALGRHPEDIAEHVGCSVRTVYRWAA